MNLTFTSGTILNRSSCARTRVVTSTSGSSSSQLVAAVLVISRPSLGTCAHNPASSIVARAQFVQELPGLRKLAFATATVADGALADPADGLTGALAELTRRLSSALANLIHGAAGALADFLDGISSAGTDLAHALARPGADLLERFPDALEQLRIAIERGQHRSMIAVT